MLKEMSVLKCEILKPCSLFPIPKLGQMSNSGFLMVILGEQGRLAYDLELKTINFTSLNYHDRVHLCVIK